ncbi:hypothetical protein CDAR_176491 [Caerostris darwini]|uniref:Uncharacterized protein n=1 Tax=Caerostris darwini TaxID=1538125 RepID=A0AAV4Q658_9ARAC|nr:hypothetical protein CDAR_176491 [Caerostris darwini]
MNDVLKSTDKAEEILKIKTVYENSEFKSKDNSEDYVILDASLVSKAFEYFVHQKTAKNSSLNVSYEFDDFKDSYAVIKEIDSIDETNSCKGLKHSKTDTIAFITDGENFNIDLYINELLDEIKGNKSLTIDQSKIIEEEFDCNPTLNFDIHNHSLEEHSKYNICSKVENSCSETDLQEINEESMLGGSTNQNKNLFNFCINSSFLDELDYEPLEIGDIEGKSLKNESFDIILEENESVPDKLNIEYSKELLSEIVTNNTEEHPNCINEDNMMLTVNKSDSTDNIMESFKKDLCKRKFVSDEDDSESDNEYSFKRNSRKNIQKNDHSILIKTSNENVSQVFLGFAY